MKKDTYEKFVSAYFKFAPILIALLFGFVLGILVYCLSFYVHEGGHIIYGFTDNLIHNGTIAKFNITSWIKCPVFSFELPQQTTIIKGRPSLNLALGGPIITILFISFLSLMLYKNLKIKNKKAILLFPLIFLIHEFFGNFLCGTDNIMHAPHPICEGNLFFDIIIKSIPYLLAIPLFFIIYPLSRFFFNKIRNKVTFSA